MMLQLRDICQCPDCGGELDWSETHITCKRCREQYSILNGIPYFLKEHRYWCEIPKEQLQEINDYIKEHGWDRALEEKIPTHLHSYIVGAERADGCLFLLPIGSHTIALDLGCMWGALTFPLAQHCGQVIGVDQTFETLRMADLRKRSSKVNNIFFAGANSVRLPFMNCVFDVVIINGVLEWIGLEREYVTQRNWGVKVAEPRVRTASASPRSLQLRALKEAHRTLKPGGTMYVATENRISWLNFSQPDPHSGFRYTSLMPRWLADIYMKLRANQKYLTYTYSARGLGRLLAEAGFIDIKFFTALPDYRYPHVIMPLEERFLRFYMHRQSQNIMKTLMFDFLSALRLAKHLVDCFLVRGRKG